MNNRAVSETLGVDYQMHFMRTRGGDNRHDLRTHQYIEKDGLLRHGALDAERLLRQRGRR